MIWTIIGSIWLAGFLACLVVWFRDLGQLTPWVVAFFWWLVLLLLGCGAVWLMWMNRRGMRRRRSSPPFHNVPPGPWVIPLLLATTAYGDAKIPDQAYVRSRDNLCVWACLDTIGRATDNAKLTGIMQRVGDTGETGGDGSTFEEMAKRLDADQIPHVYRTHDMNFVRDQLENGLPVLVVIWNGNDPNGPIPQHCVVLTSIKTFEVEGRELGHVTFFDPEPQRGEKLWRPLIAKDWQWFKKAWTGAAFTFPKDVPWVPLASSPLARAGGRETAAPPDAAGHREAPRDSAGQRGSSDGQRGSSADTARELPKPVQPMYFNRGIFLRRR